MSISALGNEGAGRLHSFPSTDECKSEGNKCFDYIFMLFSYSILSNTIVRQCCSI